jgi:hypothetical protein
MRDAAQKLDRATTATEREQRQLADIIGIMKEKHIQRFWLMALPAAAFVFAFLISPIFLSTLPFGLNDVAASIVTGGRWYRQRVQPGSRLATATAYRRRREAALTQASTTAD